MQIIEYNSKYDELQYFGKYKDQVPEDITKMKNIPKSKFVKDFLSSQVCSEEELKELVEENPKIFTFKVEEFKPKFKKEKNQNILNIR